MEIQLQPFLLKGQWAISCQKTLSKIVSHAWIQKALPYMPACMLMATGFAAIFSFGFILYLFFIN